MQQKSVVGLDRATWIGLVMLAAAIIGLPFWEVGQVRDDIRAIGSKIDSFQAEMRDLHGRVAKLEVLVQQ